ASLKSVATEQGGELDKLRSEIQALRRQNQESSQAGSSQRAASARGNDTNLATGLSSPTVPLVPVGAWAHVGTANPKNALETLYWAIAKHETNTFGRALAWEPAAEVKVDALFAAAPESVRQRFGSVDGVVYALFSGIAPLSGFAVVSENVDG